MWRSSSALVCAWLLCTSALAADSIPIDRCPDDCVAVGQWQLDLGLGLGLRTNPLAGGQDVPLLALPHISYYGERFFLRNLEVGFTLYEDRRHQLHAVLVPSHDQMHFNRWDPLNFLEFGGGPGGTSAVSAPLTAGTSSYSVDIYLPGEEPRGVFSPEEEPGTTGPAVRGADLEAPATSDPNLLQLEGVSTVTLNGDALALAEGKILLEGRSGNEIVLTVTTGGVTINGLDQQDELQIGGAAPRIASGTEFSTLASTPQLTILNEAEPSAAAAAVSVKSVRERKPAALAGLEYSFAASAFDLHLQALNDVSGVHEGVELRAAAIFPWRWEEQNWALTVGLNYQSRRVIGYYYGLGPEEAFEAEYAPASGGVTKLVRLDWQKPVSRNWSLRALLQYKRMAEEITESPLVTEDGSTAIFVGGDISFLMNGRVGRSPLPGGHAVLRSATAAGCTDTQGLRGQSLFP